MSHYISIEEKRFLRVEEAGQRLQRIAALKKGLTRSLAGWLPRMPDFAGKCHLAQHLFLDCKGSQAAGHRVSRMLFLRSLYLYPAWLEPIITHHSQQRPHPER